MKRSRLSLLSDQPGAWMLLISTVLLLSLLLLGLAWGLALAQPLLLALTTTGWLGLLLGPRLHEQLLRRLSGIDYRQAPYLALEQLLGVRHASQVEPLWQQTLEQLYAPLVLRRMPSSGRQGARADGTMCLASPCGGDAWQLVPPPGRHYHGRDLLLAHRLGTLFSLVYREWRRHAAGQQAERQRLSRRLDEEIAQPLRALAPEHPDETARGAIVGALRELAAVQEALTGEAQALHRWLAGFGAESAERCRQLGLEWQQALPPGVGPTLSAEAVTQLRRLLREAVTNVLRHADARTLRLMAQALGDGGTLLCLKDDGRGFDPDAVVAGTGLNNMRRRALALGARIEWQRATDGGCELRLWLPPSGPAGVARSGDARPAATV